MGPILFASLVSKQHPTSNKSLTNLLPTNHYLQHLEETQLA